VNNYIGKIIHTQRERGEELITTVELTNLQQIAVTLRAPEMPSRPVLPANTVAVRVSRARPCSIASYRFSRDPRVAWHRYY